MHKYPRFLCLALALVLLVGLTACTGTDNPATDAPTTGTASTAPGAATTAPPASQEPALDHVTLDWYLAEDVQRDQEMVWAKLNEYFEETINATVNYHPIPGSEYGTKVSTFVSSGQSLDVLYATSQLPYVDYSQRGAFVAIDDLLEQYCPETYAMIPDSFWDGMIVGGHIYGIPAYKDSCNIPGIIYNETLTNAIGVDMSTKEWVSLYDMLPTFYDIQEKRAAAFPEDADLPVTREFADVYEYSQYETINSIAVVNIPGINAFEGKGSGEVVFNLYATDEYRKYCNTIKQLVDDNIMPFDAWNFDPSRIYTAEGKIPILSYGSGYIYVNKDFSSTEFDAALLRNKNTVATTNYLHQAVSCVSITSKNPERALMMLELVNTDNFVATSIRFGLEGEHYTVQDDGRLDFTGMRNENPAERGYYTWYGASIGSFMRASIPNTYPVNFTDMMIEANEQAISDTNMGFIFDASPVQNEIAACTSVVGEYTTNFKFGFIENVDEVLDEFIAKLDASGAQRIIDEAQSQLNAWRASLGKSVAN